MDLEIGRAMERRDAELALLREQNNKMRAALERLSYAPIAKAFADIARAALTAGERR